MTISDDSTDEIVDTSTGKGSAVPLIPIFPIVIAHRGASHDAPENTIAAFNLAWEQGADGIEGDFHLTGDGEIVCIHDETTERTAGQSMRVVDATLAELRRLDVGYWKGVQWRGAQIPAIGEVLATVPEGKSVFIEIKSGPEILPAMKKALAESGRPAQIVIISFDATVIAETKRQIPQLKALWLTEFKTDKNTGIAGPSAEEVLAMLEKTGADGVSCKAHTGVDQQFMHALRRAHREVHMWGVDNAATVKRFSPLGIDSFTTNRPGWLKRKLQHSSPCRGTDRENAGITRRP